MSFTVATSWAMITMAGENADTTATTSSAILEQFSEEAEAYLSNLVKFDIVGGWTGLNAVYRPMFSEWAARYGGMQLIAYNPSGFSTIVEAEDMINIHAFRMQQIKELLDQADVQDFMSV